MPEETSETEDQLEHAKELIRSAAKWLVGALGAIGALLVAGSQLSSIGSLDGDDPRLWVAVVGLAVGLSAVLYAIWQAVDLLLPDKWTLSDLSNQWSNAGAVSPGGVVGKKKRKQFHVVHFLATHPEYLGGYDSIPDIKTAYDGADPEADLTDILELIDNLTSIASYRSSFQRFKRMRWHLAGAVALSAIGIGIFAWSANPSEPDQPPASLRGSDLSGSDLTGVNLENADLTRADFSDADLTGANLKGAIVEEVDWSGTTCPDGVPSASADGTCEGHLVP